MAKIDKTTAYPKKPTSLAVWICIAWCSLCSFTLNSWADLKTPIQLEIPSQSLQDALIELGKQAQISVIFPSNLTDSSATKTQNISGHYSPIDALELLIAGRDLEWTSFNSRVVSLKKKLSDEKNNSRNTTTPIEEVVVIGQQVTGSRIRRLDYEGAAPVDIITEEEIAARGVQTISDYLKFIPAVSGNSTSTAVSNGGDGTATITLRGLPASSTLVLINGRRTANSGLAGNSVDLNSIPLVAVERIEVLKDGASAIYGSDAIAGVVNIILKRSAPDVFFDQYYGETSRKDQETINSNFLAGFAVNDTDFMISASHFDQEAIFSRDREVSQNADGRAQGGVDLRSSATPLSRIQIPNDEVVILRGSEFDGSDPLHFRTATSEDLYNYREATSSFSPSKRSAMTLSAVHMLNEFTDVVLQLGLTKTETVVTLAPEPLFTAFEEQPIIISANQIYNPFGEDIIDVRRRLIELGPREQTSNEEAQRINVQIESSYDFFHWDAAINFSKTVAKKHTRGIINKDRLQNALSDDCDILINCEPLNLFGPTGSITEAQVDYIRNEKKVKGSSQLTEFLLNTSTQIYDWLEAPIGVAAGLSVREEVAKLDSDSESITGAFFENSDESRRVSEIYFETSIPIIKNRPFAYQLDIDIASRYSKYSDFGDTNNPKYGIRYRPYKNLLFRNTYSKGFRAPSLDQLYQTESFSYDLLSDPCSMIENVGVLPGCTQLSDSTRNQFLTITGGNESLLPERSTSKTLGVVWTPQAIQRLSVSLDWFQIDLKDVIDARPQFILDQNAEYLLFPSQVMRDAQGNIITVYAKNINVGSLSVAGLDSTIRYRLPSMSWGDLMFSFNSSYMHSYHQQPDANSPTQDIAGNFVDFASDGQGAIPKWKINTGLSWSYQFLKINYNINYIDSLTEDIPDSTIERNIDHWITHSVQLDLYPKNIERVNFSIGIDNIFDSEPPFAASAFNDNFDQRTYEIKGRSWYFRFGLKL